MQESIYLQDKSLYELFELLRSVNQLERWSKKDMGKPAARLIEETKDPQNFIKPITVEMQRHINNLELYT
jgi:hypothetical protein